MTERLTRKPPQVEATIPTRRKTSPHCESKDPQAETWGAEIENERFSISRVKAVTTGGMENGPKTEEKHDRDASAYDQVRKAVPSHNLQENSQARFCQLDTTVARRNRPVKSRRGLRQAPRGQDKRRPAQARRNHHTKESLEEARSDRKEIPADAQGIKGTRVATARLFRRRGGQATTHTRACPIRSSVRPQSPAQRPERRAVIHRGGPEHAEVPPIKERPAVVGRNPA